MSANEHIEELLSGFLDGELTAEELREFELALAANSNLKVKLEQLRQLGNDLRNVPKRKLGEDFTQRVLAAAAAASREGSVVPPVQLSTNLQPAENQANGWKLVGVMAVFAASLLLAVFAFNGAKTGTTPSGDGIVVSPPVDVSPTEVPDATGEKEESFVRNDPNMRKRVSGQNSVAILTILEVEPSEKAWNEDEISKVLRDSGIVWTNPVKVSDDVLGVLNETRSISQGLPKADDEKIVLVMVMAKGRTIDRALLRISEDFDAFPHVFFDMAFDLPGKELCQKLVDAQGTVVNGNQAVASPIVPGTVSFQSANGGLEKFSHFTAAPLPPEKYLPASSRKSVPVGNPILAEEENADSYVLLVIRQPAK